MIMQLHALTHHESRMCPIDFEVKRSKVKVMAHGYLKMVSGRELTLYSTNDHETSYTYSP